MSWPSSIQTRDVEGARAGLHPRSASKAVFPYNLIRTTLDSGTEVLIFFLNSPVFPVTLNDNGQELTAPIAELSSEHCRQMAANGCKSFAL